jgi:cobalt-zinc-cadmium resistance protein CzcA
MSVYYNYDENNLALNGEPLKVFGVAQDFKFPTVYFADKKVNKAKLNLQQSNYNIKLEALKRDVNLAYSNLNYTKNKAKTYKFLDSLYGKFVSASVRRFELGETNYLEMISAKSKQKQLETLYKQSQQDVLLAKEQLIKLVQTDTISIPDYPLQKLELQYAPIENNIGFSWYENSKNYFKALNQQEKQNLLPDLSVEYFQGTNSTLNTNIKGYQLGVKIPLFFSGNASKIKASEIAQEVAEVEKQDYKIKLNAEYQSLLAKLNQYNEAVNYYETEGKKLSEEIIKTAERTFKEGEIDFFQYIQSIETATDIELSYLENLNAYNQTIITINYLIL